MLRGLTRILRFQVGFHTENIQKLMKNFSPINVDECIDTLKLIDKKKQYIAVSPIVEGFVDRIQYTVLKKQKYLSPKSLYIYQTLKKFGFLTGSFKYQLFNKLEIQLSMVLERDMNVKNTQLLALLWFIYRQYPFYRQNRGFELISQHTLKLFQMLQYMNTQKQLPTWQPYLRITTLLKHLGHQQLQLRPQPILLRQQIQALPYKYIPYLTSILPQDHQQLQQIQQNYTLYNPLYTYLTQLYIEKDKYVYDAYIQHVQTIDNQRQGQEIQRYYDVLTWDHFVEFLGLFMVSTRYLEQEELNYKVDQLFWRLCETANVQLEAAVSIVILICRNQNRLGKFQANMLHRSIAAIKDENIDSLAFLPSRALVQLLSATTLSKSRSQIKKQILIFINKAIKLTKNWQTQQADKQQLLKLFENSKYLQILDAQALKILNK